MKEIKVNRLQDLKRKIESKDLNILDEPLVFQLDVTSADSFSSLFLCDQYIQAIADLLNKKVKKIESLEQIPSESLIDNNDLYILNIDNLDFQLPFLKSTIVVANKISKNVSINSIKLNALAEWQLLDYTHMYLPGLSENSLKQLVMLCRNNPYRLQQEINKLKLYTIGEQEDAFKDNLVQGTYSDLNSMNIFNFTEALMNKDMVTINTLIPLIDICDLEPLAVVTILMQRFNKIADFLLNPAAAPESCKMSDKQFYFLKHHPEKVSAYSLKEIIKNIDFLTSIDYKIKNGELDFGRDNLLDYLVINILGGIR